jgi:hypothetical protein
LTAVQIAFWLGQLVLVRNRAPSVAEIIEFTGCSRATAYRWRKFAEYRGALRAGETA